MWPWILISAILIGTAVAFWLTFDPDALEALAWLMTGTTLMGIVLTSMTTFDMWREYQAIQQIAGGDRILSAIASANIRRDTIRTIKLLALFLISASVVVHWSNPYANRSLLVLVIVLMVANSMLDRLERQQTADALTKALIEKRNGGED
jgi:hypothetical protein